MSFSGSHNSLNQCVFLGGPTACGKSDLALTLAERIKGEIISVDSMQVYRGLNIGTAKPTPEERRRVPHHLIDVVALDEFFDAAAFVAQAQTAVEGILSHGRVPIFCGGTGLYFKAYLEGLGSTPAPDPSLRAQLEATSLDELLEELQARDPLTFQKIDRSNPRRVVRALQIIHQSGRPWMEQRAAWSRTATPGGSQVNTPGVNNLRFFGIRRSLGDLHTRIEKRVDQMFFHGLVAETELLLKQGLARNRTATQAIGYRQVIEYLQGVRSLSETISLVKQRTRQLAKRQMTWFRNQAQVTWLDMVAGQPAEDLLRPPFIN